MAILAPLPTRPEWLEWRRTGAGASDVSAILGISRWGSPWATWAEKVGLVGSEDDLDDDDPREFGRRAEAMIAPWFTERTGKLVVATQLWAQHDTEPWMLATPDGAVGDERALCTGNGSCPYQDHIDRSHFPSLPATARDIERAMGRRTLTDGLEIKVDFGKPWYDGIPADYQAQGQWQMACTGWERVWFSVLHGRKLRIYELERDEEDIEFMINEVGAWWARYVLGGEQPPVDGSDATARAIARAHAFTTTGKQVSIDDLAQEVPALIAAKAQEAKAKERGRLAKSRIMRAMGDAEIGTVGGFQAVTLRSQTRTQQCKHCGATDTSEPFRVLRTSSKNPRD